MTAYKCNRCGILYEPYTGVKPAGGIMESNGLSFARTDINGYVTRTTVKDLCPKCMAELAVWWGGDSDVSGS